MIKKVTISLITLCLLSLILMPSLVLATDTAKPDTIDSLLDDAAGPGGAGYVIPEDELERQTGMARIVGTVARIFISLLGVIFISYVILGGYLWMTAGGNEEKVTKAKTIIQNGIIGLIVVLGAAAIYFLFANVLAYGLTG